MWNIASRMGVRSYPATPIQKQGFHTLLPVMTGFPIPTDKTFTNPNYVNPRNPSVLGYDTVKTPLQSHNNIPIETDVRTQKYHINQPEKVHKENSSVASSEKSTEQIVALPQEKVDEKSNKKPVGMCIRTGKRNRKHRRNRNRKQRDYPKNPGKHCKNLDKEQKHSKLVEQQRIIEEELQIEKEISLMSCQSLGDNTPNDIVKVDRLPQLCDYLPVTHTKPEEIAKNPVQDIPKIEIAELLVKIHEDEAKNFSKGLEEEISDIEDQESISETIQDSDVEFAIEAKESDDEEEVIEDEYEYSDLDEVDNAALCFTISFSPCKQKKIRQLSTTESEDSFIVFDSGTEEEECDYSDEGEEDSDTENVETDNEDTDSDFTSSSSVIPVKKVRFADDSALCTVHPMVRWAYAYRAARMSPWRDYRRDEHRFQRRVSETEKLLAPIFLPGHREKVYGERFNAKVDVPMDI